MRVAGRVAAGSDDRRCRLSAKRWESRGGRLRSFSCCRHRDIPVSGCGESLAPRRFRMGFSLNFMSACSAPPPPNWAGGPTQMIPSVALPDAPGTMALRAAAATMARSATGFASNAPGVFFRGFAGAVERFSGGQPVQTKRPAYDERDTPHTDKWLEVRAPTPSERTARPPPRTRATPPHTFPHPANGTRGFTRTPSTPRAPAPPRGKPRVRVPSRRRCRTTTPWPLEKRTFAALTRPRLLAPVPVAGGRDSSHGTRRAGPSDRHPRRPRELQVEGRVHGPLRRARGTRSAQHVLPAQQHHPGESCQVQVLRLTILRRPLSPARRRREEVRSYRL